MTVTETTDRALLRAIFARDPIGAIYLLGDLEDRAFSHCRWWTAGDRAVVLLYSGLATPIVLPFGEPDALRAILRAIDLPERLYTKLDDRQLSLFRAWRLSDPVELYAMGLDILRAPVAPVGLVCELVADAALIEPLYADYPGNYFDPVQVHHGFYAAGRLDGRIVAAAGTHAYASREGAAALGNVVTASDYRGRGIAAALVAFLCRELEARGVRHIGLHVERVNAPAIACYRRIGFSVHSAITQYSAQRGVRAISSS
jgi:ribosomal protein S18 acetylase RimI-like enzyme